MLPLREEDDVIIQNFGDGENDTDDGECDAETEASYFRSTTSHDDSIIQADEGNSSPSSGASENDMIDIEDDADETPPDFPSRTNHEDKLKEVLRNLCLVEPKIVMDASKDFIRLLGGDSGGEVLCYYVKASPQCTELWEAWKLQKETRGLLRVWSLIVTILQHPAGKEVFTGFPGSRGRELVIDPIQKSRHYVSKSLEKFARSIVDDNLDDVYAALGSAEITRQKSALLLMAAIVRRSSSLAYEVIRKFDFSSKGFKKLLNSDLRKVGSKSKREQQTKAKTSARGAFIEFAMSFLEASNPRVLRWVLQKKEIYAGVLQGLSRDDDETIIFVLHTLQNKVLSPQSLVPPSLQSVLFGDLTLEQLSIISGNPARSDAAEFAHKTLMMVCSDPSHGLVPDFDEALDEQALSFGRRSMKGNPPRLLRLMLKLKAAEVGYHKELLLAMLRGKPSLTAAYMESFPYSLEPRSSPYWFSAVSLASDVVSIIDVHNIYSSVLLQSGARNLDTTEMHTILKCILPSSFTRAVINRGLLHSNFLVRHGSLKILLEALRSMDGIVNAINVTINTVVGRQNVISSSCWMSNEEKTTGGFAKLISFPGVDSLPDIDRFLSTSSFTNRKKDVSLLPKLVFLKQGFQDELRAMVPDPQVLLKLLSSMSLIQSDGSTALKRQEDISFSLESRDGKKNCQSDIISEYGDIFINRIEGEVRVPKSADSGAEDCIFEKEGLNGEPKNCNVIAGFSDVAYFQCKLLEVLTLYMRIIPDSLFEGSYDFFKLLPSDPMLLSICQLQSLLSLLLEYIKQCRGGRTSTKNQELIYRHLQPLIKLMLYSPMKDVRSQASLLAREAMMSTGAFDANILEIEAWLMSLPGYFRVSMDKTPSVVSNNMVGVMIRFLCDAVSTVGNNLHKSLTQLQSKLYGLNNAGDTSPDFGPLVICILQKCMQILESDNKTFKLTERCMVSAYVRNSLKFLLQIQVDPEPLSSLIISLLSAKFEAQLAIIMDSHELTCEWRPLRSLFYLAKRLKHQEVFNLKSVPDNPENAYAGSLSEAVSVALGMIREGHDGPWVAVALSSSLVCAEQADLVDNFLPIVVVFQQFLKDGFELLLSLFSMEHDLLSQVAKLWPDIFYSSLEMVVPMVIGGKTKGNEVLLGHKLTGSFSGTLLASGVSYESAAFALCMFLQHAPLHMLLPATVCFNDSSLLAHAEVLDLLKAKISEASSSALILLLRFILFWLHQIEMYRRAAPCCCMEKQINLCFSLVEHALVHTLQSALDDDTSQLGQAAAGASFIEEVVGTIFIHPAMKMFLLGSAHYDKEQNESVERSFQDFLFASKEYVSPIGNCVMCLLRNIADTLSAENRSSEWKVLPVKKACRNLLLHLISAFMEEFGRFVHVNKNQVPCSASWYMLSVLMQYISPFVLLELVDWIFSRIGGNCMPTSKGFSPMSVGIYVAEAAFEMLPCHLVRGRTKTQTSNLFWEVSEESLDVNLLEKVYSRILDFFVNHPLENVETCLLQAVSAAKFINWTSQPPAIHLPFSITMLRMVSASPMEVVVHCIHKTNKVKSKLLLLITEMSPPHLDFFGEILLSILRKGVSEVDNLNHGSVKQIMEIMEEYSDSGYKGYILLLPTAVLYFLSNFRMEYAETILKFYSEVLLDGFLNWESFVTGNSIFLVNTSEIFTSIDELIHFFSLSTLGKAVHMLHHYINGSLGSKKQRNALFNSICASPAAHDELLCDVNEISSCSYEELLNLVNKTVAKLSLLRILLCPRKHSVCVPVTEGDVESSELFSGRNITSEEKLKPKAYLRLMSCLVCNLDKIIQSYPLSLIHSESSNGAQRPLLVRFLEVTILTNLVELSAELGSDPVPAKYLTFLEPFIRSSLLHRFEDPLTLQVIRSTLLLYSTCHFNFGDVLKYLLAHSLFVPIILWIESNNVPSLDSHDAVSMRPPSSILQHLQFPEPEESTVLDGMNVKADAFGTIRDMHQIKLEMVKLLRALVALTTQNLCVGDSQDVSFNSRDLLSLLLSGYGATMNEIDLEVYHLMHEIELMEGSYCHYVADMDFLWGSSASKIKTEQTLDKLLALDNEGDSEIDERRRRRFLENLAVDSRLSIMTVLNFPYNRIAMAQPTTVKKLLHDSMTNMFSTSSGKKKIGPYDPDFILRFSIHGLSRGFFEAIEFARLGLLAISFVSISSPDEGIRKLGYDSIGKFKKMLEGGHMGKTGLRLQLLLTYLQNGITEPWQKIPSVIAVFAAEASFIVIEPSQNQFITISQLMTDFSGVDLEAVPLFHKLFGNCTTQCQSDRGWILRLLYVGLNLDDDALIFRRNFLLELLFGFHASSLAKYESRIVVLQLVKKAVKLPILLNHLVKNCGLISWLSSLFASCTLKLYEEKCVLVSSEMKTIFEVLIETLSSRRITLWLQETAYEQLSELSSCIHSLFVHGLDFLKEHIQLVNFSLWTLMLTMRISTKRKIFKPHFSLSFEGLYHIYLVIADALSIGHNRVNAELGLECILMNPPPQRVSSKDKPKLLKLVVWCLSTAMYLQTQLRKTNRVKVSAGLHYQDHQYEEDLVGKLLRWMTALVIRGKILGSFISLKRLTAETLESFLDKIMETTNFNLGDSDSDILLAVLILYLQQLQGNHCNAPTLISVVSALRLLLPFDSKYSTETGVNLVDDKLTNEMSALSSRVPCPVEANPAWRWSYYQPWKDLATAPNIEHQTVEDQCCESLLIAFSKILSGKVAGFPLLFCKLPVKSRPLTEQFSSTPNNLTTTD